MDNTKDSCLICEKHKGIDHQPPGGYIYKGKYFSICHAPLATGPLGTVFIESNRHLLDYAEMTQEELAAIGSLLGQIYQHLKKITGAERIYQVTMLEGVPHFHTWLVPRRNSDQEKGVAFISKDLTCQLADVQGFSHKLQQALGS